MPLFNIDWEIIGGIVASITALFKGVKWIFSKFEKQSEEIEKLKHQNEELKILAARQAAVLEMISNYLKETVSEGLEDFVGKNDNK